MDKICLINKKKYSVFLIAAVIIITCLIIQCFAQDDTQENIVFRLIYNDVKFIDGKILIPLIKIFPDYKFYIPENFYIKNKEPDLKLGKKEIKKVEIKKKKFYPVTTLIYEIVLYLNQKSAKQFSTFSEKNKGKFISIEIKKQLLTYGKIIHEMDNKIAFSVSGRSINEIKSKLIKISNNVEVIDSNT